MSSNYPYDPTDPYDPYGRRGLFGLPPTVHASGDPADEGLYAYSNASNNVNIPPTERTTPVPGVNPSADTSRDHDGGTPAPAPANLFLNQAPAYGQEPAIGTTWTARTPEDEERKKYFEKYQAEQQKNDLEAAKYSKELNRWWTPLLVAALPAYGHVLSQRGNELERRANDLRRDYFTEVGRMPAPHWDPARGIWIQPTKTEGTRFTVAAPPTATEYFGPGPAGTPAASKRVLRKKTAWADTPITEKVSEPSVAGDIGETTEAPPLQVEREEYIEEVPKATAPKEKKWKETDIVSGGRRRKAWVDENDPDAPARLIKGDEGTPAPSTSSGKTSNKAMEFAKGRIKKWADEFYEQTGRWPTSQEEAEEIQQHIVAFEEAEKNQKAGKTPAPRGSEPPADIKANFKPKNGKWVSTMTDPKTNQSYPVWWNPKTQNVEHLMGGGEASAKPAPAH